MRQKGRWGGAHLLQTYGEISDAAAGNLQQLCLLLLRSLGPALLNVEWFMVSCATVRHHLLYLQL